ncbi:MAG: TonB-dependent receptor [Candidatus Saccharicenans sp.]|nr:TonB-dependent receptor [Candidatus Saccharicenans sp.]MDH7574746.1 TonB-dependent receptor [Candidatus Saccharicenans sp.]
MPATTEGGQEQSTSQKKGQTKEEEKPARVRTEGILVTAPSPEQKPLASVFVIRPDVLELFKSKNIAEVLSFAPGTYVTTGSKAEAHVKIRGLDNDKSTLLLDGIPIYEPYFNLYNLRTIPSLEVEYAQVTKGPSSVLYGANTMGGIVEVLTRRPQENSLELRTRLGPTSSFSFSGSGTYVSQHFSLKLATSHEETEGYKFKDSGATQLFPNTDYRNNYFSGKVYFFPGQRSEILLQTSFYDSAYGVPVATAYYSPRYWRFKDWQRFILGLGGTFPLFKSGTLKIRTYYINYYNVLDAYTDATYSILNWESIYKNYSAGAFFLATVNPRTNHELRFSLNGRLDKVKQQASETSPWEYYKHNTYSFGLEDEWKLTPRWHLLGGLSLDYLQKQAGGHRTSLNPIIGLKFRPQPPIEFHLSYAQKSRFPSMRSLYSSTSGNPDLKDEVGRTFEFGTAYHGWVDSCLALFTSNYRDFISVIRQPDGTRLYVNVGKARIRGLELETDKSIGDFNIQLQYTYLKARNLTENRKLDLIPTSQVSLLLNYFRAENIALAVWLIGASKAEIVISNEMVNVPAYVTANLSFEKFFRSGSIFLKVENLFNRAYFTEPGYPVSSRRIEIGFGFHTGL